MKNLVTKLTITLTAAAAVLFTAPRALLAQPSAPGIVQGHAQNALGIPFTDGVVKLSTDHDSTDDARRTYSFTGPMDKDGNYKITGVTPGSNWIAFLFNTKGQLIDYFNNIDVKTGSPTIVNFDMTRKEYIDKMTPEEKAQMEEIRKHNAGALASNAKIANLNAMLLKARDEMKTDPDDSVSLMTQATTAKPDEPILWLALGQAEQADGDAFYAKTKKYSDADVQKHYHGALDAYKKAVDLELAKKTPSKDTPTNLNGAYKSSATVDAKLGDTAGAVAAYDAAAKALPAAAYDTYNLAAATFYNANKMPEAAAAADKAIAADPSKPDPYYVKGQALIQNATVDPATQKITAPPGCVEAYNKYLELAPTGVHADEVKGILQGIGQTVTSSYGTKKKK